MKAMLRLTVVLLMVLFSAQLRAQEKQEQGQKGEKKAGEAVSQETRQQVTPFDEILLDALHLDAQIEKPSVSIVAKRIEPRLEGIEYIIRDFDRELLRIPDALFDFEQDKRRFIRIQDGEKILARRRN